MKRQGFDIPLLIGGATTSAMHTAVKIDPQYPGPVVYVKDASRAVGVAQNLVGADSGRLRSQTKADYVQNREQHANRRGRKRLAAVGPSPRQSSSARPMVRLYPAQTEFSRHPRFRRLPAAGTGGADRLDAVLPCLGTARAPSGYSR